VRCNLRLERRWMLLITWTTHVLGPLPLLSLSSCISFPSSLHRKNPQTTPVRCVPPDRAPLRPALHLLLGRRSAVPGAAAARLTWRRTFGAAPARCDKTSTTAGEAAPTSTAPPCARGPPLPTSNPPPCTGGAAAIHRVALCPAYGGAAIHGLLQAAGLEGARRRLLPPQQQQQPEGHHLARRRLLPPPPSRATLPLLQSPVAGAATGGGAAATAAAELQRASTVLQSQFCYERLAGAMTVLP
jgi:hypothetical protein